jgi:hypothetical protein
MSDMQKPAKPPYRFNGMQILYFGIGAFVLGALLWIYTRPSGFAGVGLFLGLAGVVLLVIGFVRVGGERRAKQ